jgi:cysteinyl-tRNA synthetase
VRAANAAIDAGDTVAADARRAAVDEMCTAVGLEARAGGDDVDAETADLVARRDAARAAKDWSTADSLRDALVAKGWVVEDTAGGTRVHRNQ